jgi:hypothetical protein
MSRSKKYTFGDSHEIADTVWAKCSDTEESFLAESFDTIALDGTRANEDGYLVVPMRTSQKIIVNVLTIYEDGRSYTKRGCSKSKTRFYIGTEIEEGDPIFIVDDFLEGATIFEATWTPVVVVFYWQNIEGMIKELREQFPNNWIYIVNFKKQMGAWSKPPNSRAKDRKRWDNLTKIKNSIEDKILSLAVINEKTQEKLSFYDLYINLPFNKTLDLLQFLLIEAVNKRAVDQEDDLCFELTQFPSDKHELRRRYLEGFIVDTKRIGKVMLGYSEAFEKVSSLECEVSDLQYVIDDLEKELEEKGLSTSDMKTAARIKRDYRFLDRYYELVDTHKMKDIKDIIFEEYKQSGEASIKHADSIRRVIENKLSNKGYMRSYRKSKEKKHS